MKIIGGREGLIGEYDNGNYHVSLYDDGTKIRQTEYDNFIPEFPESIDMNITNKCDGHCPYCYISSTRDGKHCIFERYENLLDSIHPYTEIAINGNDLSHPGLYEFLKHMKERNVVVNITVNQIHFVKYTTALHLFEDAGLVHGIGVSLQFYDDLFLEKIREFKNIVIHVIAGITSPVDLVKLRNNGLSILILGYKRVGYGVGYFYNHQKDINLDNSYYYDNLDFILKGFRTVSFDNLAIKDLQVKEHLSKEEFDKVYMGDDGEYTMYVDLVKGIFAKSSLDIDSYVHKIEDDMSIVDCFNIIRGK